MVDKHSFHILLLGIFLFNKTFAQENTALLNQIDSLYFHENYKEIVKLCKRTNLNYSDSKTSKIKLMLGNCYENLNKEDSAFIYYKNALKGFETNNQYEDVAETNLAIYMLLDGQKNLKSEKNIYLKRIYTYAKQVNSKKWLAYYFTNYGIMLRMKNQTDSAKYYFKEALTLADESDIKPMRINLNNNLGSLYSSDYKNYDSALYYYNNGLKLYFSDTLNFKNLNKEFDFYNNIGNTYRRKKDYQTALKYYLKAESLNLSKLNKKSKQILYSNMEANYYYMNDWYNAYNYIYKYDSIKDEINLKEQNVKIRDIEEKYDNEKLRADNLEIESKRKQNRNYLLGALAFILFGGITALLIQKNTRKKQKLAEQEQEIQKQKVVTLLKEQELLSIDAMIEGQEKERQRIANDLHDDLGGIMATVKLHFNALKDHQTPELFDKTNTLLDEAYNKVRTVAHAKNSGVIAKQGLLKAVQNMADKISVSNQITIDVIDFGLENRLENSMELTVFRIIQELITNIIKHAEATEATINLTNHKDSLNIMVEDNGKGFNPNQITTKNKGMGISSIDKRVEHLNGTMTIESEPNRGTTVIIDIPI